MAHAVDGLLDAGESTAGTFIVTGYCDLFVDDLTSGSVQFQIKFPVVPGSSADDGSWRDFPEGEFTAADGSSHAKTVFISEHGVRGRLTNVGGNDDVYARIARYNNK